MTDSCQHEAQVRHLKSRVSQLEIMLEKERRRSGAVPQQALIPRRATTAEVLQAPEHRQLQQDLEHQQKVKTDLMANLKEMTITSEATRAALVRELEESKTSRDAHLCELDELQEEYDASRTMQGLKKEQLTPATMKAYLADLVHAKNTLQKAIATMPSDMGDDLSAAIAQLTIDRDKIKDVLRLTQAPDLSAAISTIEQDRVTQSASFQALSRTVPSTYEELFTLLNRSSSFAYPSLLTSFDDEARENYEQYLKTTTSKLSHTIRKYITSHQKSRQKISYRSFNNGDLALFLPTRNATSAAWAAFNVGAPHYFLDMTGVETENKDFLIGRIEQITEKNGEPGIETPGDVRKWWQVKISDKRKIVE